MQSWTKMIRSFDQRRDIIIPGDQEETVRFCAEQFIQIGQKAIEEQGYFAVALSGGSTPHAIFRTISQSPYRAMLDWSKVLCFWSDERSVPPHNSENNFYSGMQAGLATLPLLTDHIFRMEAEGDIEQGAIAYEEIITKHLPSKQFDLMMLGMGEDGHTASLFPLTDGLHADNRLVVANYVPQKKTWRMSLTYECINSAKFICIYVLGSNKAPMVAQALTGLYDPDHLPIQKIGTPYHKALWILDAKAARDLLA